MDSYKEPSEEESIDVKKLVYKFLSKWYLFVASIIIALFIAYLYNTFTQRIYEVKATILVKDEQTALDSKFSAGLGIYNTQFRISNETGILKSFQITRRALEKLNFGIDYFSENSFNETELYNASPFEVLIDSSVLQPVNVKFQITLISKNEFKISIQEENVTQYNFKLNREAGKYQVLEYSHKHRFFEKIKTKDFAFTIVPHYVPQISDYEKLSFRLNSPDVLIKKYRSFNVSSEKNSSIITLSIKGTNVNKLTDFLNTLTSEYLKKGIEKKNLIAENTIKFIDTQVGEIADSLVYSEQKLQNYRSENRVMNMDFQAQQAITALENYKNQRAEIMVKARYYEYLKNYLKDNKDGQDLVAPSALGISDPVLSNLINELTRMFNERLEMMFNSKKDNPYMSSLDMRINSMKKSVLENIESLINATEISMQDIDERIAQVSTRVNKLPETQRQLFGFERKFKLNDAIYTYLLTKRSEMQIAKASYLPDNEVIDNANDLDAILVSPNSKRNFLIAFFLGLGLPMALLLLRDYLNTKIMLVEDIESITDFPILGYILRHKEKTKSVVLDFPKSLTSESFRGIRANFQFISNENNKNVVLITSSMMSEGKSFITINLAQSFALNNKKCVILSFDLRKPKVSEYLSIKKEKGISSFLSSDINLDDIIIPEVFPNLDIVLSGPIPPNPMELISNEKTKDFFRQLKERYDYIFVDTPPIGMVADALILLKYSDVNIYVTRYNYTNKNMLANVVQNLKKRGINNLNILINDVPVRKKVLSYSNNFDYGYGYDYYYSEENNNSRLTNNKKKNIFRNLISKAGLWL
jgi:capsular exopolysaccharide synthesis family protein